MILDLMLRLSGTEILRRVEQESTLPVIVLTAKARKPTASSGSRSVPTTT